MTEDSVRGERGPPLVSTTRSLQSRISSIMACGLMILLGAAMLTWYYSSALTRQSRARQATMNASARRVQGEMPLPRIDGFSPLRAQSVSPQPDPPQLPPQSAAPQATVQQPIAQQLALPEQLPLMPSTVNWASPAMTGAHSAPYRTPRKGTDQLSLERQLSGAAFEREPGAAGFPHEGADPTSAALAPTSGTEDIAPLLQPVAIASARAHVLPTRRFILQKGAFIDCTLETAIDSTLPGMTTCVTATDTFSADGTVVLLERGTKLIGETRGQVHQGTARVFVLWTEARTPAGIVVPLDSPGTDELGRSGLPGSMNRHFWERFGAAILISTLDGAVQTAVQSASRGGGPIIYNPSSTESVVAEVLKDSVNIPPTLNKQNGDRIQVFVARDIDFRSVYELRTTAR